jgi:hypothetical protein
VLVLTDDVADGSQVPAFRHVAGWGRFRGVGGIEYDTDPLERFRAPGGGGLVLRLQPAVR